METTTKPPVRRRSLLDLELKALQQQADTSKINNRPEYSDEYIEKVKSEIRQWEEYLTIKQREDKKEYQM